MSKNSKPGRSGRLSPLALALMGKGPYRRFAPLGPRADNRGTGFRASDIFAGADGK